MTTGRRDPFEEVTAIRRLLELGAGFSLEPVVVPAADQAGILIRTLERHHRISVIEPRSASAWSSLVADLATRRHGADFVAMIGPDEGSREERRALRLLNQRRDVVAGAMREPLLWIGTAGFHARTWEAAPDWWSIRAVGFRLD